MMSKQQQVQAMGWVAHYISKQQIIQAAVYLVQEPSEQQDLHKLHGLATSNGLGRPRDEQAPSKPIDGLEAPRDEQGTRNPSNGQGKST